MVIDLGFLPVRGDCQAQIGPSHARVIHGATKKLPMMLVEQKPRKVVLDLFIDADGRVTRTAIVQSSGNGIFDERMRGYWKDSAFVPALDAEGKRAAGTLRVTNEFSVDDERSLSLKNFRNHSEVAGNTADQNSKLVERMRCRDLLWEYDFMRMRAPKAKLDHEDVFHVAFAMFLASGNVNDDARDALIREWPVLIERVVAACREKPDELYWQGEFVRIFARAAPYQSLPVP